MIPTFKECKDKIAQANGFSSWESLNRYSVMSPGYYDTFVDKAAELYAAELVKEIERLKQPEQKDELTQLKRFNSFYHNEVIIRSIEQALSGSPTITGGKHE